MKKLRAKTDICQPGFSYLSWGSPNFIYNPARLFLKSDTILKGEIYCPLDTIPFQEPDPDWQVGDWCRDTNIPDKLFYIAEIFQNQLALFAFHKERGEFLFATNRNIASSDIVKIDPPAWASKLKEQP